MDWLHIALAGALIVHTIAWLFTVRRLSRLEGEISSTLTTTTSLLTFFRAIAEGQSAKNLTVPACVEPFDCPSEPM